MLWQRVGSILVYTALASNVCAPLVTPQCPMLPSHVAFRAELEAASECSCEDGACPCSGEERPADSCCRHSVPPVPPLALAFLPIPVHLPPLLVGVFVRHEQDCCSARQFALRNDFPRCAGNRGIPLRLHSLLL